MSSVKSRDVIEDIGTLIDEAALDLNRWQSVVDELARAVPGTRVLFQVVDPALARAAPMVASGWDAGILTDYARHYGAINPWVPALLRARPMETLFSDRELAPAALRRTEFYQDWLRHIGEADASTGMKLMDQGDRLGAITFSHDARHADRINAHAADILDALAPRIRRSLDVGRTVAAQAWRDQAGSLAGALVEAALVVTRTGRLLEANAAAQTLIAAGTVLRVGVGDRVRFVDPRSDAAFADGVRRATTSGPAAAATSETRIATADGNFALSALGLRPDMLRIHGLTALLATADVALVVLRPCEVGGRDTIAHLRHRYGLTVAEARLALAMDGSRSLRAVAEILGVGHETARSQLKAVFAKLGVSRQSELVVLLLRIAAVG